MSGSALGRLRALPRWVTAWSGASTALGVLVLGVLLVHLDGVHRDAVLDGELGRVTAAVLRLVHDDVAVDITDVSADPVSTGCPQFAVLPGAAPRFPGYVSERPCVPMDPAVLAYWAERATTTGRLTATTVRADDGRPARLAVEPFRQDNGQVIGAVVAVADAEPQRSAHRRTMLAVAGGGLMLLAAVAVGGYLLSTRAIQPVAAALQQHEVLLADTAHDLRTPVAALRALAEAALLNPDRRAELLPRAVDLAERMGAVVDGVLIRARLAAGVEALHAEPLWLDQLVSTVVDETPPDGAEVTLTAAPTRIRADPALVRRAVANLLDNALRHGRTPGRRAIVHLTVAGGRVLVADHGPGVDPALARASFDRFSSTGGSSGLGLSIVRWVAEAHGGTLRVYNAEEGGAIFELVLPDGTA
ncbi:sensor histidine kinase [Mangrovihabitans endophyticus]|uniref:histidine kinase n=1 Tax=Mangrovihabitans endophyticus TaxID=1751298 RepID=A0A8J3BSK0_9ACTN|nr:HAMP domain-containing sensor histidine kinase [Mangrovihabitans endophyticus]GGK73380.1 hypothetical protein GCM10012284_04070 [Mangrovihabitans endophyticus]